MTLTDYLKDLRADPLDEDSPMLLVAEGELSDDDREVVIGAAYARRPYCVVVYRARNPSAHLQGGKVLTIGAIDVNLYHPSQNGAPPDGDTLATLQALVRKATDSVTEVRTGYPLGGRLILATEVDPQPSPTSKLGGLWAVTRFTIPVWR